MRSIGIAAALMMALSGVAFGASLSKAQGEMFMKLDANQDGYIDVSEAKKDIGVTKTFSRLDANSDGQISPTEFAAYAGE